MSQVNQQEHLGSHNPKSLPHSSSAALRCWFKNHLPAVEGPAPEISNLFVNEGRALMSFGLGVWLSNMVRHPYLNFSSPLANPHSYVHCG
jgi:hypothetical protein